MSDEIRKVIGEGVNRTLAVQISQCGELVDVMETRRTGSRRKTEQVTLVGPEVLELAEALLGTRSGTLEGEPEHEARMLVTAALWCLKAAKAGDHARLAQEMRMARSRLCDLIVTVHGLLARRDEITAAVAEEGVEGGGLMVEDDLAKGAGSGGVLLQVGHMERGTETVGTGTGPQAPANAQG